MNQQRLNAAITGFDDLPSIARVPIQIVCIVTCRSKASVWRDVGAGRLPKPVKMGRSSRWIVGDLRRALSGECDA